MNADDVDRFLDSLAIGRQSRYSYCSILRAFQAFALERTPGGEALSLETLRAWLMHEAARSPLASVVCRAGVVARYLDWRAGAGHGANPLAALQDDYGPRLHPIVRALIEDDGEGALERLRPLPEFGSSLGALMREHIARMQSLGYIYEVTARDFRRFDRFLQQHPELADEPLPALLAAWRDSCPGVRHALRVQQCGRALSQAMNRRDPTVAVLSIDAGLQHRVIQEERKPYLFTETEVERLFEAARTFPSVNAPLRPTALVAMLALAYCAGLRVGEIASLTLADLDVDDATVEIRETKFFKSRRLPLAPGVLAVISRYLLARTAAGAPIGPEAPLWWSPLRRHRYSYSAIEKFLTHVIRRAGFKPERGQRGPRVHDLRHSFVARRMVQWYRDGVDPQTRLPHLATYLGHKDIISTLVYLNMTPELLEQAGERYRQRGAHALHASGDRT
ncbi:tyrosine-type recombinase/integrase [uncultured Thiodictyon sp.]|uniref:tyrosine-type recombinase/integrase n=1 Tax=uncultured Thiodictyon sp. TaxID=1846217 RepID=UPI0025FB55C0|nr:tyrosine-type recombinase/integrase [uncultured Thiodictyon sp.]